MSFVSERDKAVPDSSYGNAVMYTAHISVSDHVNASPPDPPPFQANTITVIRICLGIIDAVIN